MIPRLKSVFALVLALCLTTLIAGSALAGAATDSVKKTQNDLFDALKAGDDKKVDTLFGQFIDYETFAKSRSAASGPPAARPRGCSSATS